MPSRRSFLSMIAAASAWQSLSARAQEMFSPFVGSDPLNVARMVKLAAPASGETVIDLGSGDGRIVFAAVKDRPGVRGIGVDINAGLVAKANAVAATQQLDGRVQFLHQNVFDADLGKVDVIFMWLFPELMRLLRPKILREARPGTRVVTATWDLGTWPADVTDEQIGNHTTVRLWHVPARVGGYWQWETNIRGTSLRFDVLLEQHMQQVEGSVRVGNRRQLLRGVELRGASLKCQLNMTLPGSGYTRLSFEGQVRGDVIEGTIDVYHPAGEEDEIESPKRTRLTWTARRTATTGYFAPTGTDIS